MHTKLVSWQHSQFTMLSPCSLTQKNWNVSIREIFALQRTRCVKSLTPLGVNLWLWGLGPIPGHNPRYLLAWGWERLAWSEIVWCTCERKSSFLISFCCCRFLFCTKLEIQRDINKVEPVFCRFFFPLSRTLREVPDPPKAKDNVFKDFVWYRCLPVDTKFK